ncbi:hypothetical protein [Synechococcus sp. ROS8604]|uniref:hypothetical protein n=1 Tax=Synechococcus sp. ROS8604 TaxID=1442557 RepID=UPI0016490B1E|nr:hypothetical protein [Synechococcus sp. ROS8604]QNI88876.1 hypothetical protein SynROS8604_02246 [Synechococcus sp. ROS8604]
MQRNDPSSLSFGARLKSVEEAAINSKRKLEALEKTALDPEQKKDANERRRLKRKETARASGLLTSAEASLADLESINQDLLPLAQRDLVQQDIVARKFADAAPSPIKFTPEAQLRIRNFQQSAGGKNHAEIFSRNNQAPTQQQKKNSAAYDYYERKRITEQQRSRRFGN